MKIEHPKKCVDLSLKNGTEDHKHMFHCMCLIKNETRVRTE